MRWWERVARWDETHRFAVDAWTAGLVALVMLGTSAGMLGAVGSGGSAALAVWVLLLCGPLAWRRVRPVGSAAATMGAALVQVLSGELLILPLDLVVLVAVYSVTVHGPRWAYRTALAGGLVGAGLLGIALVLGTGWFDVVGAFMATVVTALAVIATFALGLVRRARRETIQALVDRADRLEVERDQAAQISTAAERTRIAREMHDVVAHSLSIVVAQADGGRYAAEHDPGAAVRALTTISETGRAALTDMRRILGVLRTAEPATELAPQPASGDLAELVAHVREAGLAVSLVQVGPPRPLPPGTGLSVYRICQESLTNILKHAGPDPTATLVVTWRPDAVEIKVTDDGRGAAAISDGAGQGVLGMRERATMLGGTFAAGPRPGGGYQVRAVIPLPPVGGPGTTHPAGPAPGPAVPTPGAVSPIAPSPGAASGTRPPPSPPPQEEP